MKSEGRKHESVISKKGDMNSNSPSGNQGFFIGTRCGLGLITLLGIILYFVSDDNLLCFAVATGKKENLEWINALQVFLHFLGETLIGAGIISLIMSLHTINETHQKVRDNLMLNDPSFIGRYTEEETNKLLRYSIQQKLLLNIKAGRSSVANMFGENLSEAFSPILQHVTDQLSECKFYCEKHSRNIKIKPIRDDEYEIEITVDILLYNLTQRDVHYGHKYSYIYISKEQIDSFRLISLIINDKEEDLANTHFKTSIDNQPATQARPFQHFVSFEIPISIRANDCCRYVLKYKYKNFAHGCFISYILPFLTHQYQEIYSLVGSKINGYHLQVLAYSPLTKDHLDNQDLVHKENDGTYSINVNDWALPGIGFAAVVRKK